MSTQKEFELSVVTGASEGQSLSFTKTCVSIGRDKEADFSVDDPHSSKTNATIVFENDDYYLVDNNSTNGTFLNDEKIEKARVKNGDRIRVGETVIQFRCQEEQAAADEADMTVILPEGEQPKEEVTVILPADEEEPPADEDATVIVSGEKEPADPDATVIQPAAADPDATVIQPAGAPRDPNATQLAPAEDVKLPTGSGIRKKKAGAKAPAGRRFGNLDKAARLRIMIAVLAVVVLGIFGAALLIPSSGPQTVTDPAGAAQAGGSQSDDQAAPSGELASMSPEERTQKAAELFQLGKTRHEERFLKPGSLYEAIEYFEKAERYLADIAPKPPIYAEIQDLNLESKETLQSQFNALRLDAYMLIRKRQYADARDKLEAVLKLIPNPDDDRYKLAEDKLKEIRHK